MDSSRYVGHHWGAVPGKFAGPELGTCLGAQSKLFEMESFHIWSIKYKIIIKLCTELVCKLRDEFIKTK